MIVSIHQPAYLPWLGYFDRIRHSDTFVFLDSVQFEKNSFTNRNKVRTAQGPIWLTVPVKTKGHTSGTLVDVEIDNTRGWKQKHLRTIQQSYSRAPLFELRWPMIDNLFVKEHSSLSDLCFDHLTFWLAQFGWNQKVVRASSLNLTSSKNQLVVDICRKLDATVYLSGPLGRDYLEPASFDQAGIKLSFHEFRHPQYTQSGLDFIPALAIVDLFFHVQDLNSVF